MRKRTRALVAFALLLALASCQSRRIKHIDRRITLKPRDFIPYGNKVAYDGLSYLFPNATISTNTKPLSALSSSEGKKVYLIFAGVMDPGPSDINAILDFVGEGNQLFVSAREFGDSLLHTLGLTASDGELPFGLMDSLKVSLEDPVTRDSLNFAYPGDSFDGWVESLDPQYTAVLGRDHQGRPNFIRFNYKGGGALYLHFAPLAFSNFFLLHKKNIAYYQTAMSYLPVSAQEVVWDDYFTAPRRRQSTFKFIFSNPSFSYGFWLLLVLLLLIYLIESKRRQRPIPVIQPLQNTSLDFVRTIGRLYFQRRDNHNLAGKMVNHFQDQVRTRYNLPAAALDEGLATRLAHRTGYPQEALSRLIGYMRVLPSKAYVPDEELIDFHRQLEAFYKKA
jgi:hypothetical protein